MNYIEGKNTITWRLEVVRHLLQRRGPPQRSGLATQAKPAVRRVIFVEYF